MSQAIHNYVQIHIYTKTNLICSPSSYVSINIILLVTATLLHIINDSLLFTNNVHILMIINKVKCIKTTKIRLVYYSYQLVVPVTSPGGPPIEIKIIIKTNLLIVSSK